jgi:hypothetical protein
MMNAHRVVRCDRSVKKRPRGLAAILFAQALERVDAPPEIEDGALECREIHVGRYFVEFGSHVRKIADDILLVPQADAII